MTRSEERSLVAICLLNSLMGVRAHYEVWICRKCESWNRLDEKSCSSCNAVRRMNLDLEK